MKEKGLGEVRKINICGILLSQQEKRSITTEKIVTITTKSLQ